MNPAFFAALLKEHFEKSKVKRRLFGGSEVELYCKVDENSVKVGSTALSNVGCANPESLQQKLHGHDVLGTENHDPVVIWKFEVKDGMEEVQYPFQGIGVEVGSEKFGRGGGCLSSVGLEGDGVSVYIMWEACLKLFWRRRKRTS